MARFTSLHKIIAALSLVLPLTFSAPASAQSDVELCQAFVNFGGIITGYILPLTVKDFADMNSGKNSQLVQGVIVKLDRELTARNKQVLNQLGQENTPLFEEAASDFAIDLALSAQVSDSRSAAQFMQQECMAIGARQILEIQRATYQQAGQGQPQGQTR